MFAGSVFYVGDSNVTAVADVPAIVVYGSLSVFGSRFEGNYGSAINVQTPTAAAVIVRPVIARVVYVVVDWWVWGRKSVSRPCFGKSLCVCVKGGGGDGSDHQHRLITQRRSLGFGRRPNVSLRTTTQPRTGQMYPPAILPVSP